MASEADLKTPEPIDPMPEGLELRDLWAMFVSLRRRVERYELEQVVTTLNEHDDRLDEHDSQLDNHGAQLEKLNKIVNTMPTWMSGIKHVVDEVNSSVKMLVARAPSKE